MSIIVNQEFNSVYYSFPVPRNPHTVTLLGILFDKVFLPGVYLPKNQDKAMIKERLEFLVKSFDPQSDSAQIEMISTLHFTYEYSELMDIFKSTGKPGYMGVLEPETQPVVMELEKLIYGPPSPGFTPTPNMGFNQPAGSDQINGPSWIAYPANALIYSKKNNLALISDSTYIPIPSGSAQLTEVDLKLLASSLMASAFSLILPRIRSLNAEEILEVREKMEQDIKIFRVTMLSCVEKMEEVLGNNPSLDNIEKETKNLALKIILPKVEEMKLKFESPQSIFGRKFIDLTLEAPELALNFQSPDSNPWAIIKILSSVSKKIQEGITDYRTQSKAEMASGLSLLLKVPRMYPKK